MTPPMCPAITMDVTSLFGAQLTGIGRHVARMVDSVARLAPLRLITQLPRRQAQRSVPGASLNRCTEIHLSPDDLPISAGDLHAWRRRLLCRPAGPRRDGGGGAIVHTFMRSPPAPGYAREIGILYDFTPLVVPATHREDVRRAFAAFCENDLPKHDAFLAISEATRFDAEWIGGVDRGRIRVAYPGPSQCVERHAWEGPAPMRRDFALVVSTLEPRKNAGRVLDWFFATDRLPEGFELLWAGPNGWLQDRLGPDRPNPHGRRVRFLGMVSDAELCRLYQAARFSVYASLYEGFGFPVLDSLRHGTPVLCALNSSLREFAGPGVHFFDAGDTSSMDAAHDSLRQAGMTPIARPDLEQACSWERCGQALVDLCLQDRDHPRKISEEIAWSG
jgi:glycosyltransferase involved in cell wall biosynthesis